VATTELASADYALVFQRLPSPCVVLDPSLLILDCNAAYLAVTGRRREELVGRGLFEAFPENDPQGEASRNVRRTLTQSLRTRRSIVLGAQRYDISRTGDPADLEVRYWTTTAVPVSDADGQVVALLYNVHDVTALATGAGDVAHSGRPGVRDLFRAAVEISEQAGLFDASVVAERQLGLAVQNAMLPVRPPDAVLCQVVVRYRPASGVLQVGGDWYDVTELDRDRLAVAVGDVVGHGLDAAVLMGQLRAALNALTLADLAPAEALSGLDRYARQHCDASLTTAVKAAIDPICRRITYSNAGHPPAILVQPDGTSQFLDQAQGAALALPVDTGPRPTASIGFEPGARLLLYTDGLVERRGTGLDTSLLQLADRLRHGIHQPLEQQADQLLEEQGSGQTDDIVLLLVQL
jgi:PAS domain S-box-containing protein